MLVPLPNECSEPAGFAPDATRGNKFSRPKGLVRAMLAAQPFSGAFRSPLQTTFSLVAPKRSSPERFLQTRVQVGSARQRGMLFSQQ